MNVKVGIITLYHNSCNYGGLLQAYALAEYLQRKGFEAEQIDFDNIRTRAKIKKYITGLLKTNKRCKIADDVKDLLAIREKSMKQFRDSIPHSCKTYTYSNINETNRIYDVFICGSDQIWNFRRDNAYFLRFVEDNKIKFSYAAGMSSVMLNNKDREWTLEALKKLDGISVREEETVEILNRAREDILVTVDPTLLLHEEEWRKMAKRPQIQYKYVLCYFLGDSEKARRIARDYASEAGLKIITVPFVNKKCVSVDRDFGDVQLIDLDPFELLGYIDQAEIIITDSFHISLFSCLFNKNAYTLSRYEHPEMSARITNLFRLFGRDEELIDIESDTTSISKVLSIKNKNGDLSCFYKKKALSEEYIEKMLGQCISV